MRPQQLVSDNGPQFTIEEFGHFLRSNSITYVCTAPYHQATNGLAERFALKARDTSLLLHTTVHDRKTSKRM